MEATAKVATNEGLGELIPDHALAAEEADLFDHADYVDRLMDVVKQASTEHSSANIALYGPWGSGKSSIANLFEARLRTDAAERLSEGKEERFRFLRFDAFKYARQPFLRQFIRELTSELVPGDRAVRKYHRRLYEERSRVDPRFQVPWKWPAAAVVLLAVAFAAALIFLEGKAHEIALDVLRSSLLVIVPSSVAVGLLKLAVPFFSVTSVTSAPDSEEQFEKLFNDILREELKIDADSEQRLVVFVDELDRCSPTEVVATLETLRTFLGVPGCIFIVGADQQVLEEALSEHVRQATPPDPANPYYSEGSAYLDKIFQYQMALSPFRVPRLVDFALTLVEGRCGVWERVDLEEVIPILLPTHIHSPRRVKVLLNAFALTYGVAARRASSGKLGGELDRRAAEIAKLVCLRVEFPLFARDLAIDERLSGAVLTAAAAIEKGEEPAKSEELAALPVEVRRRAIAFARGDLPAAHLLAEARDERGLAGPLVDYKSPGPEEHVLEEEAASEPLDEPPAPVRHAQALQLVRYLDKTSTVPGPRSDLIHLEAAGATFGLEPQIAQQLERDALDRRLPVVVEAISGLPGDQRVGALLMLGQRAHRAYGVDGRNVMQTLLRALGEVDVPFERVASQLGMDLELFSNHNQFTSQDLPGALAIAAHSDRQLLVDRLLAVDGALEDPAIRRMVIRLAAQLKQGSERQVLEALARELRENGEGAAQGLTELRASLAGDLLKGALPQVEREIQEVIEMLDSESLAVPQAPEEADDLEGEIRDDAVHRRVNQLARAIPILARKRQELGELVLTTLLVFPRRYVDPLVAGTMQVVSPIKSEKTGEALLVYARQGELLETVELLKAVDPVAFASEAGPVDVLLEHIWLKTEEGAEAAPEELWPLLRKLFPRKRGPLGSTEIRGTIRGSLQTRVESEAEAANFEARIEGAEKLVAARLISQADVAGAVAESIASTVAPAFGPEQEEVQRHLLGWMQRARKAKRPQLSHAYEALRSEECWVESPERERLELELAFLLRELGAQVTLPKVGQLLSLGREYRAAAAPAIALWIEHSGAEPEEVARVIEPFAASPTSSIIKALGSYTYKKRRREPRTRLALPLIEKALELRTSPRLLEAARANVAEERKLVSAICELVGKASNDLGRRRVFELWEAVSPSESKSWENLVRQVLLPIAAEGVSAFDQARKALNLAEELPVNLVPELVKGMRAAVPEGDEKREQQLERTLETHRLIEPSFQKGPVKVSIGRGRPRQREK